MKTNSEKQRIRTYAEWLAELERVAVKNFRGHFTIMWFTTNWRVCFGTADEREDIMMPVGKTFAEAAKNALAKPEWIGAAKIEAELPHARSDRDFDAESRLKWDCLAMLIGDERCDPHKMEVLGWYAWRDGEYEKALKKAVAKLQRYQRSRRAAEDGFGY